MKSNVELIQLLQVVLEAEQPIKQKLIKKFQDEVWDDENINEILSELAYDLDFYEPNREWRKEAPSYYGDDRLKIVIKTAIKKLQEQSPQ